MTGEPPGWYPLALAADAPPGTAFGTRLFGQELAIWREACGPVHVWQDRCPHRGMRLSLGFVRPGGLACLYHGWQFGPGGGCTRIPAHPALKVPGTIRATTFPAAEQAGLVWAYHGGAPPGLPPGGPTPATPIRSLALRAPAAAAAAALRASTALPTGPAAPEQAGALTLLRGEGCTVLAGLQPASAEACILHLAAAGEPGEAALLALCRWAEALRREVEAAWTA